MDNKQLPPQFIEKLNSTFNSEEVALILKGLSLKRPTTFRTNLLKTSTTELVFKLREAGLTIHEVSWYQDAFVLSGVPQRTLTETDFYNQGLLYVQSLSSMVPALILDPDPNEKILDITAAPGSKTTQMAAMMGNSGEILANDMSRVRLYKLEYNLNLQGVTNVRISHGKGEDIWKKYPAYFDKTLVDVPCSMEGRFDINDPKSYKDWTAKKVRVLSEYQKHILRSAVSATKSGGVIVYSTCTLSVEENEEVVDWMLKKDPSLEVEEVNLPGLETVAGITIYKDKQLDPRISKTVRILPSELFEGFYIAKLKKLV